MAKILVNLPSGEQATVTVDDSGGYFDQSAVEWDERTDGPMPEITLGKMQRVGNALETLPDFIPAHAAAMYQKTFPVEVPMTAALEALMNAGLYAPINAYIQSLSQIDQMWWTRAEKIHRQFPLVETVRVALSLTNEQIDNLFIAAEQIRKQRAGEV